ncbi:hypothetical protein EGR_05011 [Echinococcus granulosus]|uniref:Uncharacterized protein n=1 Tax=Echinococcus granulosus TaxID=6210 RepID=W6UGR0_ECHGR|nr:hypothetical protein EGR_05011 [Echinococcus granulosus]EUB60158.1 hypothetical protein EGR_05011 [Echinococcus granulosus]
MPTECVSHTTPHLVNGGAVENSPNCSNSKERVSLPRAPIELGRQKVRPLLCGSKCKFLKGLPLNATLHSLPKQILDHSHYGQEGLFMDEIGPRQAKVQSCDCRCKPMRPSNLFLQMILLNVDHRDLSSRQLIVTVNNRTQSMHFPPRLEGCASQERGCIRERVESYAFANTDFYTGEELLFTIHFGWRNDCLVKSNQTMNLSAMNLDCLSSPPHNSNSLSQICNYLALQELNNQDFLFILSYLFRFSTFICLKNISYKILTPLLEDGAVNVQLVDHDVRSCLVPKKNH